MRCVCARSTLSPDEFRRAERRDAAVPRPLQHPTGVHTGQALISRVAPQSAMIPSRSHSRARRALAYGLGTSLHEAVHCRHPSCRGACQPLVHEGHRLGSPAEIAGVQGHKLEAGLSQELTNGIVEVATDPGPEGIEAMLPRRDLRLRGQSMLNKEKLAPGFEHT